MKPKIDIVTIPGENLDLSATFLKKYSIFLKIKCHQGKIICLEGKMSLVLYERSGFAQLTKQQEENLNTDSVIFSHTAKDRNEVKVILSRVGKAGGTIAKEGNADEWGYTGLFKDIDDYT
ncbi:VOC family protein [Thalassobacillus sp. CUG 92003]|uniref:VOC family protein n=1 Tax=Thalassobacillus sp. CUG 92003 TaxID=2736641 RepID=UPI0015E7DD2F|nr:hypothetical protein [Thalassobacillus sp. CUG 92003]